MTLFIIVAGIGATLEFFPSRSGPDVGLTALSDDFDPSATHDIAGDVREFKIVSPGLEPGLMGSSLLVGEPEGGRGGDFNFLQVQAAST